LVFFPASKSTNVPLAILLTLFNPSLYYIEETFIAMLKRFSIKKQKGAHG